jgi:hypothetical protein
MILDNNLIVSGSVGGTALAPVISGQTVTGASAVLSTNTVDLTKARDLFEGNDLIKLRALITVAFTGLTALTVEIIQADDAALSSNVTVVGSSGAIPVANLGAGKRIEVEGNSRIGSTGQRYLGVRYTPTGTGTAGAILGEFGDQVQDGLKNYPGGFAVL